MNVNLSKPRTPTSDLLNDDRVRKKSGLATRRDVEQAMLQLLKEVKSLRSTIAKQGDHINDLEGVNSDLASRVDDLKKREDLLKQQLSEEKRTSLKAEDVQMQYVAQLSGIAEELYELEEVVARGQILSLIRNRIIELLSEENESVKAQLDIHASTFEELMDRLDELELSVSERDRVISDKDSELARLTSGIDAVRHELETIEGTVVLKEEALSAAVANQGQIGHQLELRDEEIAALKIELDELRSQVEAITDQLTQTEAERDQLKLQLKDSTDTAEALQAEVDRLSAQLKDEKDAAAALRASMSQKDAILTETTDENAALKARVAELEEAMASNGRDPDPEEAEITEIVEDDGDETLEATEDEPVDEFQVLLDRADDLMAKIEAGEKSLLPEFTELISELAQIEDQLDKAQHELFYALNDRFAEAYEEDEKDEEDDDDADAGEDTEAAGEQDSNPVDEPKPVGANHFEGFEDDSVVIKFGELETELQQAITEADAIFKRLDECDDSEEERLDAEYTSKCEAISEIFARICEHVKRSAHEEQLHALLVSRLGSVQMSARDYL